MELIGLVSSELSRLCRELGHPAYRGRQLAEWIYGKGARDFDLMSNLPAPLREKLSRIATVSGSEVAAESSDRDGTTKYLLRLSDGETVETVLIPHLERTSVCVSTQVGCPVGCVFCATADCGFVRNLTAGEILDQVLVAQERGRQRASHVVFMGMGEPLLNFDQTLKAVGLLNEEVGIGMRRLTISTVGITPRIRRLRERKLQLTLAVSLHAANDRLRRTLIPTAAKYPLAELIVECRRYAELTRRRVTFEYMLIAEINDSPQQAAELAVLLSGALANVNLIPYNRVTGKHYSRPSGAAVRRFQSVLEDRGIQVTQRLERGHAISAACGQLRRQRDAQH